MITKVELSARAKKDLRKLPQPIVAALRRWVDAVEHEGLEAVRKVPGYHDEPLGGDRKGQRSIRLSRAYRAFYVISKGSVVAVQVIEVNKHDY
jgi:proteic killer suppression protein